MRTLKILAVVLVTLAIGAAGIFVWIRQGADRKWAAAQERIRQLSADHPAVVPPMPSTPASKEIQIHFVAAIKTAVRRNSADTVEALLSDAQEFLDRLHQGARQCAASPSDFPPGWRLEWDVATLRHMMNSCVLRARQLREQNKPSEAAETALDALHLARFWAASGKGEGRFLAMGAMKGPVDELGVILAKETLSRDQLLRLERELEPLDLSLRFPIDFLGPALARHGEWIAALDPRIPTDDWILDGAPYRWRHFLPFSLMQAEAFEFYEAHGRRLIADQGSPFPVLEGHFRRMHEQMTGTKNPILESGSPFMHWHWIEFERMAGLRLLRVGARYRATGDVLPLKDPFGDKIRQTRTETRMRFWSLGADGVDHGGDPARDLLIEVDHPRPE
jgi:hypothetical protein